MSLQQLRGSLINLGTIEGDKLANNTIDGVKLTANAKQAVLSYKPIIIGVSASGVVAPAVDDTSLAVPTLVAISANGADGVVIASNESIISNANVEIFDGNGREFVGSNGRDIWGRVMDVLGGNAIVVLYDDADKTAADPTPYVWTANDPTVVDVIYPVRKNLYSMSETDLTKNTFRNVTAVERDIVTVNQLGILFGQTGITDNGNALDVAGTSFIGDVSDLLSAVKVLDTKLASVSGAAGAGNTSTQDLYNKTGINPNAINSFSSQVFITNGDSLLSVGGKLDAALNTEVNRATAAEAQLTSDLSAEVARATAADAQLTSDLAAEVVRASGVEAQLRTDLTAEASRAATAENGLRSDLNNEIARATGAEAQLTSDLAAEVARATAAEAQLTSDLSAEVARATAAEDQLTTDLSAEVVRASGVEAQLRTDLTAEANRAAAAENTLRLDLNTEIARATGAEAQLISDLSAEVARATAAEAQLTSDLSAEVARATAAEAQLIADLSAEVARATGAESVLGNQITSEVTRAQNAEGNLQSQINALASGSSADTTQLRTDLDAEVARATAAEAQLTSDLSAEVARATAAEAQLIADLSAEVARATGAEFVLTNNLNSTIANLNSEVARATAAEAQLIADLSAEVARATAAESALTDNLAAHINDTMDPHGSTLTQTNLVIAASGLVAAGAVVSVEGGTTWAPGASAYFAAGSTLDIAGQLHLRQNVALDNGVKIGGIDLVMHAHDGTASGGAKIDAGNVLFASASGLAATQVAGALDELKARVEEVNSTGGANGLIATDEFIVTGQATQASFTLTAAPKSDTLTRVWVGGMRVARLRADGGANWTLAGNVLTFTGVTAADLPNENDPVVVDYQH